MFQENNKNESLIVSQIFKKTENILDCFGVSVILSGFSFFYFCG
jgi:hypothetical protein